MFKKRIRQISCIVILLIVLMLLLMINMTLSTRTKQISTYMAKPSIADELFVSQCSEEIMSFAYLNVYANNKETLLKIGELHPGDIVTRIEMHSDGWFKIIYNREEAYVKSCEWLVGEESTFESTNDDMYIMTESVSVESVDKSSPSNVTLSIQELVTRTAIGNNGFSKILYDNTEYYIDSEYLSVEKPVIWTEVEENTQRLISNIHGAPVMSDFRSGAEVITQIDWFEQIKIIADGDNGWSKVLCEDGTEGFVETNMMVTEKYPIVYEDETGKITIYREWYENAWVYAAHLEFTDYSRLVSECANGKYNSGRERTTAASQRLDALLIINGDYSVPANYAGNYAVVRNGVVWNDRALHSEGIYNNKTGLLFHPDDIGATGKKTSDVVADGAFTDAFQFGPAFLRNGQIVSVKPTATGRAQRTFIGTNGNAGDIWLCVSDGRYNDGESVGLTGYQCASFLQSKGCTFGLPLDGGGSSTMCFNGVILNGVKAERFVADFFYFK